MRFLIALLLVQCAQGGDLLPFFKSGDPRIRSLETYIVEPIDLDGARIAVFPFQIDQAGQPAPPNPAPLLVEALHSHLPETAVLSFPNRPPEIFSAARGRADLAVDGRAHRIYRRSGGGFLADVTVRLFDIRDATPVLLWNGRKRIQWRERHPADECLLFLAEQIVFDWLDHGPTPDETR